MKKTLISILCCLSTLLTGIVYAKVPDIRIRVAQYENKLEFVMPEGGFWQLGKSNSGEIIAGKTYTINYKITTASQKKYHLMVATLDLLDNEGLIDKKEEFRKKGFKTFTIGVGEAPKTIGMPDNRVIHLGIESFTDKEAAEKEKAELAKKGISSWIYVENVTKPFGTMQITDGKKFSNSTSMGNITLKSKKGTILKNVEHSKGYSWHGFENRTYLGKLEIILGFDDCLDCIEHTDLENMLIGIVPSEISSKAPKSAMEAQAVAARGEILSKKSLRHVNSGYDYCSEQHCQVYKGYLKIAPDIESKIKDTTGKILMLKKTNKILDAVYSSNCGGHSSANQNIWIGIPNPHLQGVSDEKKPLVRNLTKESEVKKYILNPPESWCGVQGFEGASKYRWTKSLSTEEWKKVIEKANIGQIKSVEIMKRDVSGRVFQLKLTGSNDTKIIINELEVRQIFGGLRSSCFIAEFKKNKQGYIISAEFKGAGFGHGVGMCQTGAQSMAGSGYSYEIILEHYFPQSRLVTLY